MEWSKIPTNLITGDYSDAEILAIVKYQLLYALDETEPSEKKIKRFLNKNQIKKVQPFINDIKSFVDCDIKSVTKIKNKNKRYYNKHKGLEENQKQNSAVLQDVLQDGTDKIREDKIREDISFIVKKEKISDQFINPTKDTFVKEYKKVFDTLPYLSRKDNEKLVELSCDHENIEELIPIALERLKKITFKDINYKPTASWLLKDNNFEKVMNGEFADTKDILEGVIIRE